MWKAVTGPSARLSHGLMNMCKNPMIIGAVRSPIDSQVTGVAAVRLGVPAVDSAPGLAFGVVSCH